VTDAQPGGPGAKPEPTSPASAGTVVWRRATSAAYVESPERVVVVDLDHLELPPYVFEGSAARIWACVDGDRSEVQIVTDLAGAYDVTTAVVAPDVRAFVERLRGLGLVVAGSLADGDR
jgi:Coenzyme PQQ synthesis protein D (PqqD)